MAAKGQGATVARNYADALLALARKDGDPAAWGQMIRQVADVIDGDVTLRNFLDSPRVAGDVKSTVLSNALADRVPRNFLRFIQALVRNRRQTLIPFIADEYETLLDESLNVVHARVTVAKPVTDAERDSIAASLAKTVGQQIIPHVEVDPRILGGIIVRMGDTVMDGSVRRRLDTMKRNMAVR